MAGGRRGDVDDYDGNRNSNSKNNGEGGGGGKEKEKEKEKQQYVSFYKLFSFADGLDVAMMLIGTIGAAISGLSQPFMAIVFGQLINSFADVDRVLDMVSDVSPLSSINSSSI